MPKMKSLGSSGLQTPPLVLGGNVFGWTAGEQTSFQILDAFVAAGGTMIDTADVYSSWAPGNKGGESETIIGRWLKRRGHRDDVLIATKVGYEEGLAAKTIADGVDKSLSRLGTDYIDLYYSHKDDPNVPLEETLSAFDALKKAGKIRAVGASQIAADRLREAIAVSASHGIASYSVLQTWYNLVDRPRYEGALSEAVQEKGLGMLSFYSLANGYLTGKYRSEADIGKSVRGARALEYMGCNGPQVLAVLDEVAKETGATQAQVALAWVGEQPGATAAIASATSLKQIEELVGAMELEFSSEQVERLNAASGGEAA